MLPGFTLVTLNPLLEYRGKECKLSHLKLLCKEQYAMNAFTNPFFSLLIIFLLLKPCLWDGTPINDNSVSTSLIIARNAEVMPSITSSHSIIHCISFNASTTGSAVYWWWFKSKLFNCTQLTRVLTHRMLHCLVLLCLCLTLYTEK